MDLTCIIAITDKTGTVWLAGDKLGSNWHTKQIVKDQKVFKIGDFYFRYTSSFYIGATVKILVCSTRQNYAHRR